MAETDPWDDWESAADLGLNDYHPPPPNDDHEKNKTIWTEANTYSVPEIITKDTAKTMYTPEIKILKRPTNPGSTTRSPSLNTTKKEAMTYEEREASYQAARRKIFGDEAKPDSGNMQSMPKKRDEVRQSESPRGTTSQARQPRGPPSNNTRGFDNQAGRPPRRS
ncbi:hypothetical protein NQZ79_g4348 [Umbelopsis isabellina]|nr:hypothetical protein NQZ79_g4348 [Umbelopsis isabellina]